MYYMHSDVKSIPFQGQTTDFDTLDSATTVAVQITVLGLTFTEWMVKVRDEEFTFDLVTAMATDFFFLYDVIDMFMLSYKSADIFQSGWVYVSFVVGFIALFKYLPRQPTTISLINNANISKRNIRQSVICTVVSILCNDLPFFIVRLAAMIHFGFRAGDVIHPAKNLALIAFGCTELYILHYNFKKHDRQRTESLIKEKRCCRNSLDHLI